MKITIDELKNVIRQIIKESNEEFQNAALDNMSKQGGFDNLSDLDKLALLGGTNDYTKLKKLNLGNIFREMGGTFGNKLIKVKIKPVNEQPIKHKFSQEMADQEGYLSRYIDYTKDGGDNGAYVTVTFKNFKPDTKMKGGGTYPSYPIMLQNMFPIDYDHTNPEFVAYEKKVEQERNDFKSKWGGFNEFE